MEKLKALLNGNYSDQTVEAGKERVWLSDPDPEKQKLYSTTVDASLLQAGEKVRADE